MGQRGYTGKIVALTLPRANEGNMAKRVLTDRYIKALKTPKTGRDEHGDAVVPGLAIRVTERGAKSFVLVARYPGSNNPTRRALGSYGAVSLEAARKKARHWLELIHGGIDPAVEEERQRAAELRARANTFAHVAEDFIVEKLPGERCSRDAERDIRRELLPRWGHLPIAQITPQHVRDLIKAVKARPPRQGYPRTGNLYMARNVLALCRRLFGWAIDRGEYGLEHNPCERLKPKALLGEKKARSRVLSHAELGALWRASLATPYPYGPMYRLLALTGARRNEVSEARWAEFDLDRKLWAIPPARMKADAAHVIPLSDDVIRLLESLPRFSDGDFLFSSGRGVRPVSGYSIAKADLDRRIMAELGGKLEPFVTHDIRRTVRTGLSAIPGISDLVRELVIGHTKPGLHKVYDQHAYLDEKRHALDAWAVRLRGIVGDKADNVIALHA